VSGVIFGLAVVVMVLAGGSMLWGFLTAAVRKPPGAAQLLFAAAVELAAIVQLVVAVVQLATGFRPAELGTTIGYLVVSVLLIPLAWFWANNERTRWSGVVLAVAAAGLLVMTSRLLSLWVPAG
jgi:hypothetical protein